MGAGHTHALYRDGATALHRLPPQVKLVAALSFVLLVVATPREQFWAFGVYLAVVLAVAAAGRVPLRTLRTGLLLEAPFVLFAVLLPFLSRGEQVEVLGLEVSRSGLLAAFNVLAKATLGTLTSMVLASTTSIRDLLTGLERLRLPRQLVTIAGFMVRYLDVVVGEMQRMRTARAARGYDPRTLLQARALGAAAGALFVRSYERGERVHLAMVSRGWTGAMPDLGARVATRADWATGLVLPAAGALVCAAAWTAA